MDAREHVTRAQVVLTDQASVLPLLRQNIAENLPSIRREALAHLSCPAAPAILC